ncbi:hypothetical protein [Streptomyces violaceus]|uniref:hypothetical protein n=1 Tax=Streptomyces violaceus TaxID=1936 RepID=UPI0031EB75A6
MSSGTASRITAIEGVPWKPEEENAASRTSARHSTIAGTTSARATVQRPVQTPASAASQSSGMRPVLARLSTFGSEDAGKVRTPGAKSHNRPATKLPVATAIASGAACART